MRDKLIKYIPIITSVLLGWANVGQIYRMFAENSSRGQNLYSWISVQIALLLWIYWYKKVTPDEKIAIISAIIGSILNFLVIMTVIRFRYF